MNKAQRQQIFERLAEAIPEPQTELIFASPFELLVAVVLSAQATDKSVNKATAPLFERASTPEALLSLGEEGIKGYIGSIGLFNSKAKHLIGLSKALIERHDSKVPCSREALEALPGVGRKTANVILNTAFGQPTIAVDTHLFRLANRIRLAPGQTVLEVEKKLLKTTPKAFLKEAHHLLILHGRYVCTARHPKCTACVIRDLCEFKNKSP
ncbi:MAG: endonuclease III [Methylococcus sp.]|nr:MAG: endonuclease III [Methylococcus sp.]